MHAGQVGAHPQAGDERAGVLAVRALQGDAAGREGGLAHGGVEHAADLRVAGVTAAGQDDAPAGANGHRLAPFVDVTVLPEALQQLAGLGVMPRRVVRPDPHHSALERLLADEVGEAAMQHELDALLPRRELQATGEGRAVAHGVGPHQAARVVHLLRRERTRALGIRNARILRGDRARLDVRPVAEHQEAARPARPRQAAAAVRAADAREPDVVVHHELPRGRAVLGPRAGELPLVVAVGALALGIDHRPVGDVREQEVDAVIELLRPLGRIDRDQSLLVLLALHVPLLDRVAAAEGHEGPAVQHPAADVEVLIDHQHAGAEIPRANGRGEAGAAAPRDDDVHLVVPSDVVRAGGRGLRRSRIRRQQRARTQPGGGSRPDEVPPADAVRVLRPSIVAVVDAFLRHLQPPLA